MSHMMQKRNDRRVRKNINQSAMKNTIDASNGLKRLSKNIKAQSSTADRPKHEAAKNVVNKVHVRN